MPVRIDIPRRFTVPVSCAGAEDEIDLDVLVEVAFSIADEEVWLEHVRRLDGGHVSVHDALFQAAEAWVDEVASDILNGAYA